MQTQFEKPHMQLALMSRWYVVSRAIHTVAKLDIANYLSDKPLTVNELAKLTSTNPQLLDRLLHFLSSYGVFEHSTNGYSLTELSMPLRDDDPYSIRDVLLMVDEYWWKAFASLDTSLQNGQSGFYHEHGMHFFDFLSENPDKQANFDKGMAKLSSYDDSTIAKAYDFSQHSSIVDLGGGRGGLAKAISQTAPNAELILFDTPSVIEQLATIEYPANVTLMSGDFFSNLPFAELYLFKGVLHDFSDEMMTAILTNCHRQMPKETSLLIAEQILPDDNSPHPNKTMDIVMMVLLGGRQQTLKDWQKKVEPIGFELEGHYQTNSLFTLMKFKPL